MLEVKLADDFLATFIFYNITSQKAKLRWLNLSYNLLSLNLDSS